MLPTFIPIKGGILCGEKINNESQGTDKGTLQGRLVEKEQKGSHLQLVHPVKKRKITIPVHGGDIPKGTLNAILKQAGLKQMPPPE